MYTIKIFVTLLLIQSLQLTFAQDEDDLGSIESLPRFEARRQSSLNAKDEFEYDDEDAASRGPVNPLPARAGRSDDDDDFDQAPQREDGSSSGDITPNPGPASVKGQIAPSSAGRLSLPRFPNQQVNSFVAPLPAPVSVSAPSRSFVVPTPLAPITVVGKTNFGEDASGALSVPRPNEPTKTVRVVTRVVRPNPVAVDQSGSLSSGVKGGIRSSQVTPTVTRVVRPVLVTRQPQPTFVQPIVQPIAQPVAQPIVRPVPVPVSIATPITSGSSGPNAIVSGGVKTVPFVANSKVQPPRLRVITTQRPTVAPVDVDEDEDSSADTRPAQGQVSGVKTLAAANPVPLVPFAQFTPTRTLIQPVRQPSRLEVIYADERRNTQEQDEDDEEGNAAGLSQPNIIKFNRPTAPIPVRVAPQPYLVPLNVQGPRPVQPSNVFLQPTIQTQPRPTFVSSGKTNSIKSTFNVRPTPVPVRQTVLTPVAPSLVPVAPRPIQIDSGSASGSRSVVGVKGGASFISPLSKVQPPRVRVITTQRPTTPVQVIDEEGLASGVSGVKGSGVASGSRSVVRPVLIRTPAPTARPLVQVQEEPLPTFQQIDLIRTQPAARPFTTVQEQTRPLPAVVQPAPRPTIQPIVQIRDGAASAELPLPSPPRPIQIVRVTPAPTARPITQVTQVRESVLPTVQPVQISQPRLVPVAPAQPQLIQMSEPARPLTQVRESVVPLFQPLDPALRPAIPTVQVSQVQEAVAPRETVLRQPARPVQVVQPQPQPQQIVQINQFQQPSVVETVQLKESAVPITSSQGTLGGQRVSQPRPQPVQTIFTTSQEPAPVPAPQSFEILRLQQPQLPLAPRQPQTLVQVRPRLIPAQIPVQTVQSSSLPVARPNFVQISQEKETATLAQPLAPAPTPVVIQQQQRRVVSFPSFQQVQPNVVPVAPIAPVAPITQVSNVQAVQTTITQPRPLISQPSVPRLIAPLPLPQPDAQSFAFPLTVQNRFSQPTLVVPQQQRPSIVVSQPQPSPLIIQRQRPVAPVPSIAPVAPISVQNSLSQSADQQLVQIREKASSIQDEFAQIEQVRQARA